MRVSDVNFWRNIVFVCGVLACSAFGAQAARAADEHVHTAPVPPAPSDVRFMPGTVGPKVFRGTATTVTIPDGTGFGGEHGRKQNDDDRRKNNYSVTDANFNNMLGLLDHNPDTGQPLTYVQHIQTYAAAGFIEAFAPAVYETLVARQNAGAGTVLGGASYLMGLIAAPDPSAAGMSRSSVPSTLPGTSINSEWYVRAGRDATGQNWARMHHAQTAPMAYKMLIDGGIPPTTALILASDDGISGAGRLNGMNEQAERDGFNGGERATWAFAAQVGQQFGRPAVSMLMHAHDHDGLDASALTRPRINPLVGMLRDDRTASDARAAAIDLALRNGTVATAQTAADDDDLVVQNAAFLRNDVALNAGLEWFDYMQHVGSVVPLKVIADNDGPHVAKDVMVHVQLSPQLRLVSLVGPAGTHCVVKASMCHVGDVGPEGEESRIELSAKVKFVAPGKSTITAHVMTDSPAVKKDLTETHEHAADSPSRARLAVASKSRGWGAKKCGTVARRACAARAGRGLRLVATVTPGPAATGERWVKARFFQKKGRRWVKKFDRGGKLSATGRVGIGADRWSLRRGKWRVQLVADKTWLFGAAKSKFVYVTVR
jgi:hypothetical protein